MESDGSKIYREIVLVFSLVLMALVIRMVSMLTFNFIDSGGGSDTVTYLLLARNLFTGKGFTEFGLPHTIHHPFYPVLIGIFWKLVRDLVLAGQLVSVLAGAALVIPAYFLGKYLFNLRTAFYSGVFVAIFPILVYGSVETFSESLYTFLLLSGIAVFWITFRKRQILGMLPAGILTGLAFLTHPAGMAFIPLLVFFLLISQFSSAKERWSKFALRGLILISAFSITCFPFWLYLHRVTGQWQLSGSSHYQDLSLRLAQARGVSESEMIFRHLEMLFHPDSAPPVGERMGLFELAFLHPGEFIEVVRYNLADGFHEVEKTARFLGIPTWLLLLCLGAAVLFLASTLLVSLIKKRDNLAAGFLIVMFLPALVFIIITIEHRYFYPFIPLGLIALGRVMAEWEEKINLPVSPGKKVAFYLFGTILFLGMLSGSGGIIYRKWKKIGIPYEYKMMGEWMKNEIPGIGEERIMMFRMGVSYYAGCQWNVFYWGDYLGLLKYLEERGINYLIIDDYKLGMIHPGLQFLLQADPPPPEFKVVKEEIFKGRKVRLLEHIPSSGVQ